MLVGLCTWEEREDTWSAVLYVIYMIVGVVARHGRPVFDCLIKLTTHTDAYILRQTDRQTDQFSPLHMFMGQLLNQILDTA